MTEGINRAVATLTASIIPGARNTVTEFQHSCVHPIPSGLNLHIGAEVDFCKLFYPPNASGIP